jgi:hypothetical protein
VPDGDGVAAGGARAGSLAEADGVGRRERRSRRARAGRGAWPGRPRSCGAWVPRGRRVGRVVLDVRLEAEPRCTQRAHGRLSSPLSPLTTGPHGPQARSPTSARAVIRVAQYDYSHSMHARDARARIRLRTSLPLVASGSRGARASSIANANHHRMKLRVKSPPRTDCCSVLVARLAEQSSSKSLSNAYARPSAAT